MAALIVALAIPLAWHVTRLRPEVTEPNRSASVG
jgi:hypothetical protein